MKFLYTFTILALSLTLFSQRGKDGPVTITALNTIVNAYTPLTSDANAGNTTINVLNSGAFSVGDLVLIIQMQGARVNAQWDTVYVDPNNSMAVPNSTNLNYGAIMNYHNAGNNEFAEVMSIPNSTSIVLNCGLKNDYTYSYINYQGSVPIGAGTGHTLYGRVQVVKVPRYSSLTVSGGGSITCPQWDGTTGGVAVVEVETNATLSSTPSFNVSGKGFRGGIKDNASSVFGGNKWGALNQNQGGYKGESVFCDSTLSKDYAALIGRGALANGGGGGDAHNAGGGGGANGGAVASYNGFGNPATGYNTQWNLEGGSFATNTSSGGGRGGYTFSNSNRNVNNTAPGQISTGTNTWGGDMRRNAGGLGGRPLDYSTGRIYLGGGGGAGDGNENQAGAGGNGGGLVYIVCYGNLTGPGTIVADGNNGSSSSPGCTSNDGAGGGGGGGTIILKTNGVTSLSATTALSAVGGNGGNVNFNCIASNYDGYGPGGSGGGGYIAASGTLPSNNISAGANGIQSGNGGGSTTSISSAFPPNGATRGGSGSTGSISSFTLTPSASQTICANQTFTVNATSTEPSATVNWYNTQTGGSSVATGTAYVAPGYPAAGTYTVFAGSCPGTYRQPIVITVTSGLSISVNSPTICAGQTAVLTPTSSATSYSWSTNQTATSISVSPATTTVYTVTGLGGTCSGATTTTVHVNSVPSITVANVSICSGQTATLTANGTATNYTWTPGNITGATYTLNPSVTGTVNVLGAIGSCTSTSSATISVTATPTLIANSTTICPSQTASLSASGATTYTWMPGSITGSNYTIAPTTNTIVTVIGANGSCTAQATPSVTIGTGISLSVNSPTICAGQSATLTATGANTYTWTGGINTNTLNVTPTSTTIYTVSGSFGACSGTGTSTVTVNSVPSISVTPLNTNICTGQSVTLTASGANTYTWSNNNTNAATQVVNPTSTTIYTVSGTGANGCINTVVTSATVNVGTAPNISVNSTSICLGQTATLTASGTATSYTWSTNQFTTSITISPSTTTIYTVTGSNGGCSTFATATVVVDNTSLSTYSLALSTCPSETVALYGTGTNSATTIYTWSNGVNTYSQTVAPVNTTTYVVNGVSLSGCPALSGTVIVNVNAITADFTGLTNTVMTLGETLNLVNSSTGETSVAWNYCYGISTDNQLAIPLADTGSCCITLVAANATCTNTVTKCVTIVQQATITIPNVFTPNGDGKNELFKINSTGIKNLNCSIFDRWGLKLYEWEGVNGYWDGNAKNGKAPSGTYFYIINYTDYKDQSITEKGFLNLFKD